ncbi:MAG: Hydrogenase expression/formation protein HypE [Verrucomicrobia bacterium ADurb.Bin345]|nr:MAG: Hydrogenase expression/formation protein HypE [Verrucomicrobia bacterium ADurb.Bin345]
MRTTNDIILLSHGGGGTKTSELLKEVILPALENPVLARLDDAACLDLPSAELAFTTDSYVVKPLFFPGGDIGRLAVCGTVNDLAMQGAVPRYLSLGLILEEGLRVADLRRVVESVAHAAREAGVHVATGDTKVVERSSGGGMLINTSGIGIRRPGVDTHVSNARPGDAVIVSGPIGDHGVAVMSAREGLNFQARLESDVAPLAGMIGRLLEAVPGVRCLRDPTRGGVAAALNDVARSASVCVRIREAAIPMRDAVRGACSLLGFDPLEVANEGKAIVICAAADESAALAALRSDPLGREAVTIGRVSDGPPGRVLLETALGGERVVDVPTGENLPRIC